MNVLRRGAELREVLASGDAAFGAWLTTADQVAVEVFAGASLDWIVVDAEHGWFGVTEMATTLAMLASSSAAILVRVAANDQNLITQALDLGADGVVVPRVSSVEEAERAVAACRFPPHGIRGWGAKRATSYGRARSDYVATANSTVLVVLQVEDVHAVESAGAIAAVEGVGAILIGPADLATGMGFVSQPKADAVRAQIWVAVDAVTAAGVPVGVVETDESDAADAYQRGCRLMTVAVQEYLLRSAIDAASERIRGAVAATAGGESR